MLHRIRVPQSAWTPNTEISLQLDLHGDDLDGWQGAHIIVWTDRCLLRI